MEQPIRWIFAGFEIDLGTSVLRKDGELVRIGRQAFRALALLVSRRGELVTREELQKEIWGDRVHVDFEHGLNVCIRQVRTALGDDADGNQIVVTCPREGYRLGVPVKRATDTRWHHVRQWATAAAVVALIGAGYLLESLIIGGPATPLNASGLDRANMAVPTGDLWPDTSGDLWPETSVTSVDPVSFSLTWPTRNSEAYAWYWRGRAYSDRTIGRRPAWALPYFQRAAALDPSFALAHASLAVSYADRAAAGIEPIESALKAKQAAQRAVTLGSRYAETHVALAELSYRLDDDDVNAEREFLRAVELDSRNAYARQRYAIFLQEQRRFDHALEQLRVAEDVDPLSVMSSWQIANTLFLAQRYQESLAQANHTLELDATHSWSFRTVGQCLEAMGKREEAIEAYLKAGQVALGHLGRVYALAGRHNEARELLTALTRQPVGETGHNGVAIAFIHTGLGQPEEAMQWLEKTHRDGVRLPSSLRVAPQWDTLRASRSFNEFLKKNDVAGIF